MSDAIKPTPGPWVVLPEEADKDYLRIRGTQLGGRYKVANVHCVRYVGMYESISVHEAAESAANARLIAEAGTVFHETGLTPSQLAERNAELMEMLRQFVRFCPTDSEMLTLGWAQPSVDELCEVYDKARAALAKCQPKPQEVK